MKINWIAVFFKTNLICFVQRTLLVSTKIEINNNSLLPVSVLFLLSPLLYSCIINESSEITSPATLENSTKSLDDTINTEEQNNALVYYSVMYRVWEQDECIEQVGGIILDRLFKDGEFNGFVCLSQNSELVGQIDTIGINFQANNLEHCKQIVDSYWPGSPSNRYSWYESPSEGEQARFMVGENTCSIEYPNP